VPTNQSGSEPFELAVVRDAVTREHQTQPFEATDGSRFIAYTDGSCLRNPDGPSGFAAVVLSESSARAWEVAGHLPSSTNNRAEWAGLASALLLVPAGGRLLAFCDSQYVLQVAQGTWKRKANLDLWQAWDQLRQTHPVELELRWVRGHAADPGNERADALATLAAHNFDQATWSRARAASAPPPVVQRLQALARGDWEQRFVKDIGARLARGIRLTPKQQAIIDRIEARGESSG
jgi:ribonuclease HI